MNCILPIINKHKIILFTCFAVLINPINYNKKIDYFYYKALIYNILQTNTCALEDFFFVKTDLLNWNA